MKVFRGAGMASEQETQDWIKRFPVNGSPEQQMGALKEATKYVAGRLSSVNGQWKRATGLDKGMDNLLDPHTVDAFQRFGLNVNTSGQEQSNRSDGLTGDPLVDKYLKKPNG